MHNVLILNYRSLAGAKQTATASDTDYAVTQADFKAQMELLHALKMPVVSLEEVVAHVKKRQRWHRHVVCLTFDLDAVTDLDAALPVLQQFHFPATFFFTSDQFRSNQQQQLAGMESAGFSFGFRTVLQEDLAVLSTDALQQNLQNARQEFKEQTGLELNYLVSSGRYIQTLVKAAQEAGFQAFLTSEVGVNRYNADLFQLKRWTIKDKTSLKAFRRMVLRNPRELRLKQLRGRSLNLGSGIFEKIKSFILKPKG